MKPDFFTSQILTGHGDFNIYIRDMLKKSESAECECGAAEEDNMHVLLHCRLWMEQRQSMNELLKAGRYEELLSEKDNYLISAKFCKEVLTSKLALRNQD